MNMDKKVSVIVPIYKVEKYLKRCIDSIIHQTYINLEIILIDDGSPDSCPEICDQYGNSDERICVIHKKNGGPSAARNIGLDIATGDYIVFVDSDDFMKLNAIEVWVQECEEQDADMVIGNFMSYYSGSDVDKSEWKNDMVILNSQSALEKMFLEDDRLCAPWGKLYKRNLFSAIRYPEDFFLAEDMFIICDVFDKARKILYDKNIFYYYNQEGTSLVRSEFNIKKLSRVKAAREWLAFADKKYPDLHQAALYRYMLIIINQCTPLLESKEKAAQQYLESYSGEIARLYTQYVECPYSDRKNTLKAYLLANRKYGLYRFIRKFVRH